MTCIKCGYSKKNPSDYNPKNRAKLRDPIEDAKPDFEPAQSGFDGDSFKCPKCGHVITASDIISRG